jgi:nicotinamidase-related amidase
MLKLAVMFNWHSIRAYLFHTYGRLRKSLHLYKSTSTETKPCLFVMATLTATFNPEDPSTPGHYGPSQTALVLLDFQSVVIHKNAGPKAPAALQVAIKMRKWALSQGIHVVHGLVATNLDPFPTCKDVERFKLIINSVKSNGGGDEAPELLEGGPGNEVTFARRPGYISAFKSPGLPEFLQEKGIKSLIITGLATSGVVLRTALAGADEEYVVTVLSDACADPDEEAHNFLSTKIFSQRGYTTTAAEFQEGFEKVSAGK